MEELIPIIMFMTIGGVLILRPVTKKLGLLIEALAKERMGQGAPRPAQAAALEEAQLMRITAALDQLNTRMDHIDDRIGFMERLVEERPRSRLTG